MHDILDKRRVRISADANIFYESAICAERFISHILHKSNNQQNNKIIIHSLRNVSIDGLEFGHKYDFVILQVRDGDIPSVRYFSYSMYEHNYYCLH